MTPATALIPDPIARHVGRPRHTETDAAILRAALELVVEQGVERTTLSAVARRANVARATVYLRWPSRERLIVAAVDAATGGVEYPVTDDVEADIRSASSVTRAAFARPEFAAMFPWLVVAILARPATVAFDAVVPKRRVLASVYARLAAAQGLDGHVAPSLAFDTVLGAHIAIFLATGAAATVEQADQIAEVVTRGLRVAPSA